MADSTGERTAELLVLGCGTSTGVPVPGCTCPVCTSDNPKNQRLRTSAYISVRDQGGFLIDASPDLRAQILREKVTQVDGVFYTHAHADHVLGTDDLRVFNFRRSEPIPCYGSDETLQNLARIFEYIFSPNPLYEGGALAKLTRKTILPYEEFELSGVKVMPFELYHGKLPVLGLRIGELSYATDCNTIPDKARDVIRGSKVLFLDGLRYEPHPTHFSIDDAVASAQSLEVEQTYLIHMTHNIDYDEVDSKLPNGVNLAYDGLRVPFKI